jgi:predicted tellurium resistance membrane protein TerC
MEWLTDPTVWAGLLTLVVLEIILGIDNVIFIAILADRLPPGQRNSARTMGLGLAMVMRLGLLASIFLVSRGSIDDVAGIVVKDDVLKLCMASRPFDVMQVVHRPIAW